MMNILNDFMEYERLMGKSEETIKGHKKNIKMFLNDYIETIEDLNKINTDFALQTVEDMKEKGYKPGTINTKVTAISVFLNYCIFKGYITENPYKYMEKLQNPNRKLEIYEDEEMEAILDLLEERCNRVYSRKIDQKVAFMHKVIFNIYYSTALRNKEVTTIKISDMNFDTGLFKVSCKGGKTDVSKLPKHVLQMLNEWMEIRETIVAKDDNDLLFVSPLSKKGLTTDAIRKIMRGIKEELNINKEGCIHKIRHTKITNLIEKGAELEKVSKFAHHASIKTTERFYVHNTETILDDLINL